MPWKQRRIYEMVNKRHGLWALSYFHADLMRSLSKRLLKSINT